MAVLWVWLLTVLCSRDNGPIPADAIRNGSRLIIVDPAVEDTGNYTCTSRELASYTAPLVIVPPERGCGHGGVAMSSPLSSSLQLFFRCGSS